MQANLASDQLALLFAECVIVEALLDEEQHFWKQVQRPALSVA